MTAHENQRNHPFVVTRLESSPQARRSMDRFAAR